MVNYTYPFPNITSFHDLIAYDSVVTDYLFFPVILLAFNIILIMILIERGVGFKTAFFSSVSSVMILSFIIGGTGLMNPLFIQVYFGLTLVSFALMFIRIGE